MDPTTSPFYQWIDHERIRAVLHDVLDLRPGERLVLLKGLVPCLVETLGAEEAESFLSELATKVRRYEEARAPIPERGAFTARLLVNSWAA